MYMLLQGERCGFEIREAGMSIYIWGSKHPVIKKNMDIISRFPQTSEVIGESLRKAAGVNVVEEERCVERAVQHRSFGDCQE